MSKGRILSAHSYIKSPFNKAFNAFPKDFFGDEGAKLMKKSSEGKLCNKINLSTDVLNNTNNSIENHPPRPVPSKDTKSYRVLNRKYVKSRASESEAVGVKFSKQSSCPRNLLTIDSLKAKEDSSTKASRNKLNPGSFAFKQNYCTNPNSSFSKLSSAVGKPVRPVIKARRIQNFMKNSHDSNKENYSTNKCNMTIKLDKIDFEKNSNCNMSVLNQSDLNVSNLIGRNQSQASFYQNSNMLGNISNSKKVKFNEFKANFLKLRQTKKIESLSRKRNNQPKLLLNNQNIHNSNRRLMLKVKSIKQVDNNTQKININIKRKACGSSLNKTNDCINYSYNGQLIYKTIEHNDKAMMEEFTDAIIPEFTLGPECFKIEERPKPQSVNKMGFYEDCKIIEEVISPIKNNADVNKSIQVYGFNIRKCSNNAALIDTSNFLETMGSGVKSDSKADEEFYQNYDLLSESKNDKEDSAQKYIDLVDSFRSLNKDKSIETPSFKEREGNKELNKKYEVKNIQGLKETDRIRCSSESNTYRRSTGTRAESENDETNAPLSKRINIYRTDRRGVL